jgi:hypothetical protein
MSEFTWRESCRISLFGLPDWAPVQRIEVPHADGQALVRMESFAVDPEQGIDAIASQHGDATVVEGARDSGLTEHAVLGSAEGRTRSVGWTDDSGISFEAVMHYALERGRLVVVTTLVAGGNTALAREAAMIAGSVRVTDPIAISEESLPLRPGQVDFGPVAHAWRAGTSPATCIEHVLTTDESFGAARHFGVAMLPGADTSQWDQLTADQRELAAAVAWRSLAARGAEDDSDLAEALQLAASHDLIVMVSERDDESSRSQWFAARTDRMVRLTPVAPGRMLLSTHPTADLADLVVAGGGDGTVTASAVYRSDGHVVGNETSWTGDDTAETVRDELCGLVNATRARSAS